MVPRRQMLPAAGMLGAVGISSLLVWGLLRGEGDTPPPPQPSPEMVDCHLPEALPEAHLMGELSVQGREPLTLPVLMSARTITLERSVLKPGQTVWIDLPGVARAIPHLDAEGRCQIADLTVWSALPVDTTCPLTVPEGYGAEAAYVTFDDTPRRIVALQPPLWGGVVDGGGGRLIAFDGDELRINGAPAGSGRVLFASEASTLIAPFRWSDGQCAPIVPEGPPVPHR